MFHHNNPGIDFAALEGRVRHVAIAGRRTHRASPTVITPEPFAVSSARWQDTLKAWPVIGPIVAWVYRGLRRAGSPGLSLRQRVRALPGVGQAAAWGHAFVTLPRWRRELREALAQNERDLVRTRQELNAMRQAHSQLLIDVARLQKHLPADHEPIA